MLLATCLALAANTAPLAATEGRQGPPSIVTQACPSTRYLHPGQRVHLKVRVPAGKATCCWTARNGTLVEQRAEGVTWVAPRKPGDAFVEVLVHAEGAGEVPAMFRFTVRP